MLSKMSKVWYFKYRPTTLDDYIYQNTTHKEDFERYVAEKQIPHLLLVGLHGTGKSTISNILINSLGLDEDDIMYINASQNNKVDFIRNEVRHFCEKMSMNGDVTKVIHMEEADRLTHDSQELLRAYMDDYIDGVRFILSCNYKGRIIPALRSRCTTYEFKGMNEYDMLERAAIILNEENIKTSMDVLEDYVSKCCPDMRKLIDCLERGSKTGTLRPFQDANARASYMDDAVELAKANRWEDLRQLLCDNVTGDQWESVYVMLYENVQDIFPTKQKADEAITLIADFLYKHAFVADPEINASALLIYLRNL